MVEISARIDSVGELNEPGVFTVGYSILADAGLPTEKVWKTGLQVVCRTAAEAKDLISGEVRRLVGAEKSRRKVLSQVGTVFPMELYLE